MKRLALLLGVLVLVALAIGNGRASACPLCKEAIEKASDEEPQDDPLREARAWNRSIYLMVSMPYLLLGGLGLLIYREYRKKVQASQPEDHSCPGQSRADTL